MAGHRSLSGPGLRLVPPHSAETLNAHDHRPTVLHAAGGAHDVVLLAPVVAALERDGLFRQVVLHAGTPDAAPIPDELRADPGMPRPDRWLRIEGGRRTEQIAAMLAAFEDALFDTDPDLVLVAGAGDAALACALAAAKQGIALAHLESGLRPVGGEPDRAALNRVLTDRLADTLLTFSAHDAERLLREGIPDTRVHTVGHTGIDALRRHETAALERAVWREHGLPAHGYVLVEFGGETPVAAQAVAALGRLRAHAPVILRVAPDARPALEADGHLAALAAAGVHCVPALGYVDGLSLLVGAGAVITDSGPLQDEASAVGVACHTLGADTDRAITLTAGTNVLLGDDPAAIEAVRPTGLPPVPPAIELWDGHAADRVSATLAAHYVVRSPGVEVRS